MPNNKPLIYGLLAVLCWSTVATAFKIALSLVDLFQLLFVASLTASVLLCAIVLFQGRGQALMTEFRRHWRLTLIAGVLNPVIYYLILFKAYELLPAQAAMSINYTWAIVMAWMAVVFLRQPLIRMDFVAAVICYIGVVVIATGGDLSMLGDTSVTGIGLALLSTVVWAGYWTLNVKDQRSPTTGLCLNFLVALPVTALLCGWLSDFRMEVEGIAASIYVGAMEMAIGFVLWSTALRLTDNASRVSNLIFLSPILSLVFIATILGEPVMASTLAGLVMILLGLVAQQWGHRSN